jgi:hypothetical protein
MKHDEKLQEIDEWLFEQFEELFCVSDLFPPNGFATVDMLHDSRVMSPEDRGRAVENFKYLIKRNKILTAAINDAIHLRYEDDIYDKEVYNNDPLVKALEEE